MLAVFDSRGNGEKDQEPGAPMRAVAQVLTERGFEVRHWEHEESRHLTVTGAGTARCEIDVYDADGIRWEYFAGAGGSAEPAEISGVVRRLLDADTTAPGTHLPRMDTLKGAVACEMRARGLKADLEAFEDHEQYDVLAEVVLSNPAKPERGVVRIDDDGVIRWEYDYGEIPVSLAVIADTTADVLGGQRMGKLL